MLIRFNSNNAKEFNQQLDRAGLYLNDQKIIGCATDTIYGIVGLYKPLVAKAIHKIKKRGTDKPFIVLVPQGFDIKPLVDKNKCTDDMLQKAYDNWPGPHTFIFPKKPGLNYPEVEKIAIRTPGEKDNRFFFQLLKLINTPVVAPSLNFFKEPPLTTPEVMQKQFGHLLDAIFFDDSFLPGSPSRIFDLTENTTIR